MNTAPIKHRLDAVDNNKFSLTTRQAARLAGVEASVLYTSVQRHGNWCGVTPRKQPNGRLLWPRDAMFRASGLVPDGEAGRVDLRAWLAFLDAVGLPEDDAALRAIGVRLLSHEADTGRDPAYMIEELQIHAEFAMALVARLDRVAKVMESSDMRRALSLIRFIVETMSSSCVDDETKHVGGER